jgi:hypothetical protein
MSASMTAQLVADALVMAIVSLCRTVNARRNDRARRVPHVVRDRDVARELRLAVSRGWLGSISTARCPRIFDKYSSTAMYIAGAVTQAARRRENA